MTKTSERIDRVNDLMHFDESLSQIFSGLKLSHLLAIPKTRDLLDVFLADLARFHGDRPRPKRRVDKEATDTLDFLLPYRDDVACVLNRLAGMLDHVSREAKNMDLEEFEDFTSQINTQAAAAFFELANLGCAVARTPMRFASSSPARHG